MTPQLLMIVMSPNQELTEKRRRRRIFMSFKNSIVEAEATDSGEPMPML
jgi:hypothetical protein